MTLSDDQLLAALDSLSPGLDPRWRPVTQAVQARVRQADLPRLEALLPHLRRPNLQVLWQMAWLGRMYAGLDGARALLADAHDPPPTSRTPEDWGALLGARWRAPDLARMVDLAPSSPAARRMLETAVQERVLRDGAVTEPALVDGWPHPDLPLVAHPWERDLLRKPRDPFDTLGNLYDGLPWARGGPATGPAPAPVHIDRAWLLDDDGEPTGPPDAPPVGPFLHPELFPNAATWAFSGHARDTRPHQLAAWPWPAEHLDLAGREAAPSSPRDLLRHWLVFGLQGGAYARGRCVLRARRLAWDSLGRLTGAAGSLADRAAALDGWQVWTFESEGPSVDHLGGDFGFVALGPDGRAWAAAHTDAD